MLSAITGIRLIQKLYLQLLYRCNFDCVHCFHGENLKLKAAFTYAEVENLLNHFIRYYGISSVTLLGGEPFLHPDIVEIIALAKSLGLKVEICTNGYRIGKLVRRAAQDIDHLRVSLEGPEETNDAMRHAGSYQAGLATLDVARELGMLSSVTMTVTSANVTEVIPLAEAVHARGASAIKLHALRPIGNAAHRPELVITDLRQLDDLHAAINAARQRLPIQILLDQDLDPGGALTCGAEVIQTELDRVEVQPSGDLYVSCKAVGDKSNAFVWNKKTDDIDYFPHAGDEVANKTKQVHYAKV